MKGIKGMGDMDGIKGWVDAALIDLDGTLVDTLGDFVAVLDATLADLDLPAVAAAEVAHTVGKGSEHLIKSVLKMALSQAGQASTAIKIEALYPRAWAQYQQHYRRLNGRQARVYPGVREGLEALQTAGIPLVCLTNKPQVFAQELLRHLELEGFFTHVFGGDSFARCKPDPLPLLGACQALGSRPERTLMVGDSTNDAQAARAAGCPLALVTYGYNHGQSVLALGADCTLDSLAELPEAWPRARTGG